jgi:hypothetical protein
VHWLIYSGSPDQRISEIHLGAEFFVILEAGLAITNTRIKKFRREGSLEYFLSEIVGSLQTACANFVAAVGGRQKEPTFRRAVLGEIST